MKRRYLLFLVLMLAAVPLRSQVVIDFDQFSKHINLSLKMILKDSGNGEAVPFASVYLVPEKDTLITNFAISDDKGFVKIEDIVPGKYMVNVEILGYKPYKKLHNLKKWEENLGEIALEQDLQVLNAANISAVGNAVSVKGDTLIFNASSFHVSSNAMLEDLLKKMPGMEVASDGTVKVNGEKVDKITVGGKTFFFDDPAMAVKNLPAKIVDKVKVIDKKKEEAEFSGVSTLSDKEKVLDVDIKEEYKAGWFGNAKASGGATLAGDSSGDGLSRKSGVLFNSNVLAAGYDDKDQITIIANGKNADDPTSSAFVAFMDSEMDEFAMRQGLITSAQGGVNYNTERLRGFESNANVSYNFNRKDAREKTSRTALQSDSKGIDTQSEYQGLGTDHKVGGSLYVDNKKKERFLLSVRPDFHWTRKLRNESSESATSREGHGLNRSTSNKTSQTDVINSRTYLQTGIKDLGKKRRSLTLDGSFYINKSLGNSSERSETVFESSSDTRDLNYDRNDRNIRTEAMLSYVEPIGEKWAVQTRVTAGYDTRSSNNDAFNGKDGSKNEYYSSFSDNRNVFLRERLLAQYKKDKTSAVFGIQLDQENNVIHSRSMGIENTVGTGEWVMDISPNAEFSWSNDKSRFNAHVQGRTDTPNGSRIVPALDISNPVQVTAGNIYLKTGFNQDASLSFNWSDTKTFASLQVFAYGSLRSNAVVYASWFDDKGVRNAIPVNSRHPGYNASLYTSYRRPLNKARSLTLSVTPAFDFSRNVSYQAKGTLAALDKDHFDYAGTMAGFWGNEKGDRFYSGKSGFAESNTSSLNFSMNLYLEYSLDRFSLSGGSYISDKVSRYSLDTKADNNVWTFYFYGEALWTPVAGLEFKTNCDYTFNRGLSDGFGKPQFIWNAKISKTIKSLSLNLSVSDILNQERPSYRSTSAEFIEDKTHNVMGRFFLVGITYNFGKMNARNNQAVQSAMFQMY